MSDPTREPTPFEREIAAASSFKPTDIFSYRPVDRVCPVCGGKHFGLTTVCDLCQRVP